MGTVLCLAVISIFLVANQFYGLTPRAIHAIDHLNADFLQTRTFRVLVRLSAVLLLILAFLERWTIFAMLLSAPCYCALGLVLRRGLIGRRRRRVIRPIPPPSPANRFAWGADARNPRKAILRFVVFIVLLYWVMQRGR